MRKYLGVFVGAAALCVMSWAQAPAAAPSPAPEQTPAAQAPAATEPQTPEATPIPTPAGGNYDSRNSLSSRRTLWRRLVCRGRPFQRWTLAGLPGWDASLGLNATNWLGFVIEGGEYFGTSKIPSATPEPFPGNRSYKPSPSPTFDVSTREYNFLFGLHLARRKYEMWTPFGELLYGHQGTRGEATADEYRGLWSRK